MVYSASSRGGRAESAIKSSYYFVGAPARSGRWFPSRADVLQALRLPQAADVRRGRFGRWASCWSCWSLVYFVDPQHASLVPLAGRRIAAAVGIRQAGADHVSGLLHRAARATPSTTAARMLRRRWRWRCWRSTVGVADLGTAIVLVDHRRHRVLRRRSGTEVHAARRRGRRLLVAVGVRRVEALPAGARHRLRRSGLQMIDMIDHARPDQELHAASPSPRATPAISRGNRRSPWAPAACWASA